MSDSDFESEFADPEEVSLPPPDVPSPSGSSWHSPPQSPRDFLASTEEEEFIPSTSSSHFVQRTAAHTATFPGAPVVGSHPTFFPIVPSVAGNPFAPSWPRPMPSLYGGFQIPAGPTRMPAWGMPSRMPATPGTWHFSMPSRMPGTPASMPSRMQATPGTWQRTLPLTPGSMPSRMPATPGRTLPLTPGSMPSRLPATPLGTLLRNVPRTPGSMPSRMPGTPQPHDWMPGTPPTPSMPRRMPCTPTTPSMPSRMPGTPVRRRSRSPRRAGTSFLPPAPPPPNDWQPRWNGWNSAATIGTTSEPSRWNSWSSDSWSNAHAGSWSASHSQNSTPWSNWRSEGSDSSRHANGSARSRPYDHDSFVPSAPSEASRTEDLEDDEALQRALAASRAADPQKISMLVDMGFAEHSAREALETCTNDVTRAVDYLTDLVASAAPQSSGSMHDPSEEGCLEPPTAPPSPPSVRPTDISKPALVQAARTEIGNCVVCLDAAAEYAVVPCGHQCLCEGCRAKTLTSCPVCRGGALMFMKIFQVTSA